MLPTQIQEVKKINPYVFLTELKNEQLDDAALKYVRELCFDFVNFQDEFPTLYTPNDVFMSYGWVNTKIKELNDIKSTLGLRSTHAPFTHIGHGLDLITISDTLDNFTQRSVFYELGLQTDAVLDALDFYKGILEKIIYTRKER